MITFSVFINGKPDMTFSPAWTFLTDKNHRPIWGEITVKDNTLLCKSNEKSFALNTTFRVHGFGEIILRTSVKSNGGHFNLNVALLEGKLEQIQEELSRCKKENVNIPTKIVSKLRQLKKTIKFRNKEKGCVLVGTQLAEAVKLGEELTLIRGRFNLRKRLADPLSKPLHFGTQPFRLPEAKQAFEKFFAPTFDVATVPLFLCLTNQEKDKRNWKLTQKIITWLKKKKITPIGHPLIWLHAYSTPKWIPESITNFDELKTFVTQEVEEVIDRFGQDIKIWSFTNEFPDADANSFDLTLSQLIELSSLISKIIRSKQPDSFIYMNLSEPWGAKSYIHEKPSVPPDFFVEKCLKEGVDFDAIGLQFYFGPVPCFSCRDLLTISETVDKFCKFGKEVHICEMSFPSSDQMDGFSFWRNNHPLTGGFWHAPWSEKIQAELAEKMYTIFASKREITTISWFDFIDVGINTAVFDRFIPHGGLLKRDSTPKLVFNSIKKFIEMVKKKGEYA